MKRFAPFLITALLLSACNVSVNLGPTSSPAETPAEVPTPAATTAPVPTEIPAPPAEPTDTPVVAEPTVAPPTEAPPDATPASQPESGEVVVVIEDLEEVLYLAEECIYALEECDETLEALAASQIAQEEAMNEIAMYLALLEYVVEELDEMNSTADEVLYLIEEAYAMAEQATQLLEAWEGGATDAAHAMAQLEGVRDGLQGNATRAGELLTGSYGVDPGQLSQIKQQGRDWAQLDLNSMRELEIPPFDLDFKKKR